MCAIRDLTDSIRHDFRLGTARRLSLWVVALPMAVYTEIGKIIWLDIAWYHATPPKKNM